MFLFLATAAAIIVVYFKRYLILELLSFPVFWSNALSTKTGKLKIIKHQYGQHHRQYVLLCLPAEQASLQTTAITYFHGGAWWLGRPEQFLKHADIFCAMGYPVIIPSYRRIPWYAFKEMRQDLQMIHQSTHTLLQQHTPCNALILGGMSAGAHLAVQTVFERQNAPQDSHLPIKGLYLFGAPLELRNMPFSLIVWRLAGSTRSPAFKIANPIDRLPIHSDFPILIIQGDQDGLVPARAAQAFADALQALGYDSLSYHLLAQTNHLEVASWVYKANKSRDIFFNWLKSC
jgi:acetyl esterase/lipase